MENKEIFEVTRDEFSGFMREMHSQSYYIEKGPSCNKIFNKSTEQLLGEVILEDEETIKYYIYQLPPYEDRIAAKPIRKIVLTEREEVEALFKILNEARSKNDRIIS